MRLATDVTILDFDAFETRTEADSTHGLGDAVKLADNRVFRHGQSGEALGKGLVAQAAAPIANHANMTLAAAALGANQVTVTPGNSAGAANLYEQGYFGINDVDGEGATYGVKGHPAIVASTAFVLDLADPIRGTALTANSQGTLTHNGYKNVLNDTVQTTRPSGVPLIAIASGDFGWFQSKGVAHVLCDTTTTLGAPQVNSGSVAGAVTDMTDTLGASSQRLVGFADIMAGVDTEYRPITLAID